MGYEKTYKVRFIGGPNDGKTISMDREPSSVFTYAVKGRPRPSFKDAYRIVDNISFDYYHLNMMPETGELIYIHEDLLVLGDTTAEE
jgi:hypothetical protein